MTNHTNDMTAMPGNPHARMLLNSGYTTEAPEYAATCQVEATLALAFEQRTQALIAYAQVADDETADRLWVDHITPRLGLDGGDRG